MVVFAITAFCVVLGVPMHKNYAVRSKVVDALVEATGAKLAIAMTCDVSPDLPRIDNESVGFEFFGSHYVKTMHLGGTCQQPVIQIRTNNTGVEPEPVVRLLGAVDTQTGHLNWTCKGDSRKSYFPESCR